jgi:predicted transcriptional regulator
MPRASQHPKEASFNFRIDPALKTAFTEATEAADKPAAQVLREFMRAYVARQKRRRFEAEARRQSRAIAERARDANSDEAASLGELEAWLDEDYFGDEWKA